MLGSALLALAACGSGDSGPDPTLPPVTTAAVTVASTTTSAPPTTAAASTTTTSVTTMSDSGLLLPQPIADPESLTALDAPPPEVDLTADTWAELLVVWEQIDAYWTWLYSHPELANSRLPEVFHPDGPAFSQQGDTFEDLAADGLRRIADSTFGRIVGFGCCPDPDTQMASGRLPLNLTTSLLADAVIYLNTEGSVEFAADGWASRQFSVELRRDELGRWLVWATE